MPKSLAQIALGGHHARRLTTGAATARPWEGLCLAPRTVLGAAANLSYEGESDTMMQIDVDASANARAASLDYPRDLLLRQCERAAALVNVRPDEAALLLDGLLGHIASEWEQRLGLEPVPPEERLVHIERVAPLIGWRLRLALRAPHVRARLVACQAMLAALFE